MFSMTDGFRAKSLGLKLDAVFPREYIELRDVIIPWDAKSPVTPVS